MKVFWSSVLAVFLASGVAQSQSQQAPDNPEPDARYKVDILEVVGHPDDDIEVAAYVAKLIEQQHKRVAVIYATRGNSGGNAVGLEQANALADVREMEARHSLASYGITDAWFLHGSDTPGADVLHSLEQWGHGAALDEIVRLIRVTRPEVILTWMPNYVVGENHEDHQAAGVLATEAFDLAANPLAFPEQVEAPRERLGIGNYGPCLVLLSLMGMDPRAAFPIMMSTGAMVVMVGSFKFISTGRYNLPAALGLAIGGLPAVLLAGLLVKSLPLGILRWIVVAVVIYAAAAMLRSATTDAAPTPG